MMMIPSLSLNEWIGVPPELREQFDIICDEMSAEGAWGEFVYRMGISKVRHRYALKSTRRL